MNEVPKCGQRGCPNPHPARPWVERPEGPIARRLAARQPEPETTGSGPAWLRWTRANGNAKDMSGALR